MEHETWKSNESPSAPSELVQAPRRGGDVQPWRVDRPPRQRETSHKAQRDPTSGLASLQEPTAFPIQMGDSDPFAALPNTVDAVMNRVLSWYRDDGLPEKFALEKRIFEQGSMPSVRRSWNRTVEAMQSPERAQTHVASVCALMAQRTQSDIIHSLALQLKGKAYGVLRQRLAEPQRRHGIDTWWMILEMFWAEQHTGNTSAAETHLKLLADWVKEDAAPQLDADFRIELLAADNVLAAAKETMPLIDAPSFAREEIVTAWRMELKDSGRAAIATTSADLDEAVSDPGLQSTLYRLRELAAVAELALSGRIRSYSVFQWLSLRLLSCESILLRTTIADKGGPLNEAGTANRDFKRNICASLTALAWISMNSMSECRQQKLVLASRLREAQLGCGLTDVEHAGSQAFALWSFYVGSMLEGRTQTEVGRDAANTWQTRHFELVAGRLHGGDWSSVSKVLARFLHSEILGQLDLS